MIVAPDLGASMAPAQPSSEAVRLLALRRSTPVEFMTGPGPDDDVLRAILTIAARAPDHRRVTPFRFILFEGEARARAGTVLRAALAAAEPDAEAARLDMEAKRFERAPLVIAVVSKVDRAHRTPEWEQILTAGAVCQNLLLAASAHGFAAQWITEWCAYDERVTTALGLGEAERIAGYVYIGTAREDPKERPRPSLGDIVSRF